MVDWPRAFVVCRLSGIVRDRIESDYLPVAAVRVFRRLCRWLPTYVIANSEATMTTLHLPPGMRADVVYSGLNRASRVIHDGIVSDDHADSHTAEAGPLVGMVGRLSPWKGQHVFVEAAARVHAQLPQCRFQIVGSAMFGEEAYAAQLREQADKLGLSDYLEFTGFREDVKALMRRFDIVVHASLTGEPFGQVVVEGMAAARPVVAARGGAIPEIIEDGVTGLMVAPGDPQALAEALLSLLNDPDKAHAMGQAAHRHVKKRFTIEQTAHKVEAVYSALLSTRTQDKPQARRP